MSLETQIARKDLRCDSCGRRISANQRYWRDYNIDKGIDFREHTNCEAFKHEPILPDRKLK